MTEAEEAARHWNARLVRPLRLRENDVHEIALGPQRAALRLHRTGYQSVAAIRSELWWCAALADAGLPVPRPIQTRGDWVVSLQSGRIASVVSWMDGKALGEAGVPLPGTAAERIGRHRALGDLLARVHLATDRLDLPPWFERPNWNRDGLTGDAPLWGRFWDHPDLSTSEQDEALQARHWLRDRLGGTASPSGLIHADVLRENVFLNAGALSLLDFDDCGFGYRWYDLGTVLSQDLYEPDHASLRDALVEGYARHLPVNAEEVEIFTLARTFASVGWAMTRLPQGHPVHRSHIDRAFMILRRLRD